MLPVSWSSVIRRKAVATVEVWPPAGRPVPVEKLRTRISSGISIASGISSAASRPEIARVATANDRDDDAGHL